MDTNRRDFLRNMACAALAAEAVGCTAAGSRLGFGAGVPMSGFCVAPANRIRVDIPDFTCGGWKTAKPFSVIDCDVEKIGLKDESRA